MAKCSPLGISLFIVLYTSLVETLCILKFRNEISVASSDHNKQESRTKQASKSVRDSLHSPPFIAIHFTSCLSFKDLVGVQQINVSYTCNIQCHINACLFRILDV